MFTKLKPYRKAIVAAALAGGAVLYARVSDGLTTQEYVEIALAALTALGATWAIPNAPKDEPPAPTAYRR